MLCTSCRAAADSDKTGSYFEYDQRKLEEIYGAHGKLSSPGRGRGRGGRGRGRGGRGLRRMCSSEERMRRFKESEESRLSPMRGESRDFSSGFQSPYVEHAEDDDTVGPQSLAYVEQPSSSIPAFFFFLLHNRSVIEKSLFRKSPYFRGMPKGYARNEKVAEEGAAIWLEMSTSERDEWVDLSMKDFEQRCVAWKEKQVIESMMKSVSDGDQDAQEETDPEKAVDLLPEDEVHIASSRARIHQFNKVKTQPAPAPSPAKKTSANEGGNTILLNLLNDARFRPLPLVSTARAKEDLVSSKDKVVKVAVQQFLTQGPIETSLGDDCMGCTRGWAHYCPVLKRSLPCSEHRAKLQPPVSRPSAFSVSTFPLVIS